MMRSLLLAAALFTTLVAPAQKFEEYLNYQLKPASNEKSALYYVVTERKDSLWHRTMVYRSENKVALEGAFKDKECTIPHGTVTRYNTTGGVESTCLYDNGKKNGTWKQYFKNGHLSDSAVYVHGQLTGVALSWHEDGSLADSTVFDPAKGGTQKWFLHDIAAPTYWTEDSAKVGRWKYYTPNGQLQAEEEYTDGKRVSRHCYDAEGRELANCDQKDVTFPGGEAAWRRYLERNLNASLPVDLRAPPGTYTARIRFLVNTDGSIEGLTPTSNAGYGTEQEVLRVLKVGPRWVPAMRFGQPVKAYREQPVTFVISEG